MPLKNYLTLVFILLTVGLCLGQQSHKRTLKLMGTQFDLVVVANDSLEANAYIDLAIKEISRIERLISSWDANSQTSEINRNAGVKAVQVDMELLNLINRAVSISKLTDGAFDISYASMDRIWRFDGTMINMPTKTEIANSVAKVGYKNIVVDTEKQTVFLRKPNMKIGFGAIGKGYAADRAKALLMKNGAISGVINASGDMNTWGKQPNGKPWNVAITNPLDKNKPFALLPLLQGAVVTSGDYERFVEFDGKRYSHIIDPRSGYPTTGILSVTVFAPKAELADALATSVFVMGIEVGLNRINQIPRVECVIVDETGQLHASDNIQIEDL